MGEAIRFHLLNVFSDQGHGGNQLAVVESLGRISESRMQALALDFNFSETTFIEDLSVAGQPARVRIFTPRKELPFAGHPTLGTAEILRKLRAPDPAKTVVLLLGVGEVPVEFGPSGEPAWMTQAVPEFGATLDAVRAADILGLDPNDVALKPTLVSTGARFLVVGLRGEDALGRALIQTQPYLRFCEEFGTWGIGVFAELSSGPNHFGCRVFAPGAGVPEDPATGSHAGCLAAYVARLQGWSEPEHITIFQGASVGRPSVIFARASTGAAPRVGGHSTFWGSGSLPLA